MTNFSSKSISELSQLLKPNKYKKIFILSGKNSFFLSGAKKILDKSANNKEFYFYLKKSKIPEINELKDIIFKLKLDGNIENITIGPKTLASKRLIDAAIKAVEQNAPYENEEILKQKNEFSILIIYKID